MFLRRLQETAPELIDFTLYAHRKGLLLPDTYVIDLEIIRENARKILSASREQGVKLYYMLKQLGRNPVLARMLDELGYEGAVYREVATRGDIDFEYDNYVFVGFNMLQEVEKTLFKKLQEAGKAHFYWDFDKAYMPHAGSNAHNNEAGHFISQYLADFPNELDNASAEIYDNLANEKKITYISASTENAQAKYASAWLRENNRYADGRDTAVIMCDENILLPVVHSLPPEADKVNITSGYPLGLTPVSSLTNMLIDLYTVGSTAKGDCYRLHYVNRILKHPYARHISPAVKDVMKELQEHKQYYPSCQTLTIGGEDKNLCLLFPPY